MAFGSFCSCHVSYQNLFPINFIEDKFSVAWGFAKNSNSSSLPPISGPAFSYNIISVTVYDLTLVPGFYSDFF